MKLTRKSIGRIAASFVATAMLATMAIVPASAAPVTGDGTNAVDSFTITKHLTKEDKTMTPKVDFTFTVNAATATNEKRNGIPVTSGVEGGVTVNDEDDSADFAPGDGLDNSTDLTDTVTFDVNLDKFSLAGIYKYTIAEDEVTYDGITKDPNVLDLYVYIQTDASGSLKVAYTELVDPDGGVGSTEETPVEAKTDSFTNDYDSINKTALHDLVLYKVVSGNAANMSEKFDFTVKIDGETGEKYYVEIGKYTEEGGFVATPNSTMILTSGTASSSFKLGNGDAIKIYGLDSNDTYTIEEVNDNTNGYTLKINDIADDDGITTGTISSDTNVVYENNKNASTPTGIVMDIAPYAVLVVIAAAGCFIFLRKRHAKED